jgi:hypothetical protein
MKNQLFYSILRYKHGLVLGESLNAGILFFNPATRKFSFELGDLKRIASVYQEIHFNYLKSSVSVLLQNIKKANEDFLTQFELSRLENFISNELLFSDAAGLTFDSIEEIPFSNQISFENTKEHLKQLFLVDLGSVPAEKRKRNEEYILGEVNRILKSSDSDFHAKIERNRRIKTQLIDFSFDFYWRAKGAHFAKAISLDLEQPTFIQNKALQIFGALEQLKYHDSFVNSRATIDVLISKPQTRGNFNEFDKALKIIDSIAAPHQIYLEGKWKNYVDRLIDSAEKLTEDIRK